MQRRLVREWRPHRIRPQYQDLVLAATARALAEHPGMNAHLVGDEIRVLSDINLGFAVSVPGGLIVPVIRDAGAKSALEIAREVRGIMSREKANELHVDDMRGGTFVVTNLGAVGVDAFDPLLDPPMIGILGVGRVVEKPAVVDGEVVVRFMCYLSLTFDHRAVDGYPAGEFLRTVTRNLASPDWMVDDD
jgi:pyruvate dehydrogenase E2 component (dihydrolipoamide acetyltransferase)